MVVQARALSQVAQSRKDPVLLRGIQRGDDGPGHWYAVERGTAFLGMKFVVSVISQEGGLHCSVLLQSNCPVPATTPVPAAAVVVDSCLVLVEIASYDEWCLLFLPISVGV